MRSRHPFPLLVAGAACLLIVTLVVQFGSPAASPAGGTAASGAGTAASGAGTAASADATSPVDEPGAAFSALVGTISSASYGAGSSRPAIQSGGPASQPIVGPVATPQVRTTVTPAPPALAHSDGSAPVPGSKKPSVAGGLPVGLLRCPIFPPSNVWNKDISSLPVAANSATMVDAIGRSSYLHPDFDAVGDGIPYNVVTRSTPMYSVAFDYADESDAGPYPIPANPKIEAGSDRHMLMLDTGACRLYELYDVRKSGSAWLAGSGAIWNLRSNALRPDGWTSADAAGLPILPGLVRYRDVQSGVIRHAIRFTAPATCGYIYPARHLTASPCQNLPPMGLRVRLKASVDISGFGPQAQVVLTALKHYGMILADNGSPWYISGEPDTRWNDDELHHLQNLTGADFEVVDTSSLRNG